MSSEEAHDVAHPDDDRDAGVSSTSKPRFRGLVLYLLPIALVIGSTATTLLGSASMRAIVAGVAITAVGVFGVEAARDRPRQAGYLLGLIVVLLGLIAILEIGDHSPAPARAAPNAPTVTIDLPRDGAPVPHVIRDVEGTARNLPAGSVIWLAVRLSTGEIYPATMPCTLNPATSRWVCADQSGVYFGTAAPTHASYDLLALVADGKRQTDLIGYDASIRRQTVPWQTVLAPREIGAVITVHRTGL